MSILDILHSNQTGFSKTEALIKELDASTLLDLQSKSLNSSDIINLCEALKENTKLTSLNLSWNRIGDEGIEALAEVLGTNQNLTHLSLGYNSIGPKGAQRLAAALENNQGLTSLDLKHNPIGAEGTKALAAFLETNQSLTMLDLCFTSANITALAKALVHNQNLTSLNIERNKIGLEGTKALISVLEKNISLTDLKLSNISKKSQSILATYLERNKALAIKRNEIFSTSINKLFPPVLADIISGYAGIPLAKKVSTSSSPDLPLPLSTEHDRITHPLPPSTATATATFQKKPSFLSKLNNWLGSIWKVFRDFIRSQWDYIKNKFNTKESSTLESHQSKVPPPPQAIQLPSTEEIHDISRQKKGDLESDHALKTTQPISRMSFFK